MFYKLQIFLSLVIFQFIQLLPQRTFFRAEGFQLGNLKSPPSNNHIKMSPKSALILMTFRKTAEETETWEMQSEIVYDPGL